MADYKLKPPNRAVQSNGVIRVERRLLLFASPTMESAITHRLQIELQRVPVSKRRQISKSSQPSIFFFRPQEIPLERKIIRNT